MKIRGRDVAAVLTTAALNFAFFFLFCAIGDYFPYGPGFTGVSTAVEKEFSNLKIYRPESDLRMLYPFIVSPFVDPIMFILGTKWLKLPTGTVRDGIKYGAAFWVFGALHGLFMDYTYIKQSGLLTLYLMFTTLIGSVICGATVYYFKAGGVSEEKARG